MRCLCICVNVYVRFGLSYNFNFIVNEVLVKVPNECNLCSRITSYSIFHSVVFENAITIIFASC